MDAPADVWAAELPLPSAEQWGAPGIGLRWESQSSEPAPALLPSMSSGSIGGPSPTAGQGVVTSRVGARPLQQLPQMASFLEASPGVPVHLGIRRTSNELSTDCGHLEAPAYPASKRGRYAKGWSGISQELRLNVSEFARGTFGDQKILSGCHEVLGGEGAGVPKSTTQVRSH